METPGGYRVDGATARLSAGGTAKTGAAGASRSAPRAQRYGETGFRFRCEGGKRALVVELLGRSNGVGFQISSFFHFFDMTGILAYTLAFALVIFSIEALLLRPLETHMNRWRT